MELETVKPIVPIRPLARRPVLLLAALGLLVLCGGMTLMLTNRRQYREYTSKPQKDSQIAFVVSYPDNWTIPNAKTPTFRAGTNPEDLELSPHPPIGFARWWTTTVLRRDIARLDRDRIHIELASRAALYTSRESVEGMFANTAFARFGIGIQLRRFTHRLGPALDVTITIKNPNTVPRAAGVRDIPTLMRWAIIFPEDSPAHQKTFLSVGAEIYGDHRASIEPDFQRILDSLRYAP